MHLATVSRRNIASRCSVENWEIHDPQELAGSRLHFDKSRLTYFETSISLTGLTCLPRFRKIPPSLPGFATPNRKSRGINSVHWIWLGINCGSFWLQADGSIARSYRSLMHYVSRRMKIFKNNEIFILNTRTMINFIDSSLHYDSKWIRFIHQISWFIIYFTEFLFVLQIRN